MAWLPVNIAMILGHQDLTLGEGSDPCNGVICMVRRRTARRIGFDENSLRKCIRPLSGE
jgi:hypothetical protein